MCAGLNLRLEYTTRFPPIYSLEKLTLVAKNQSQSADSSWHFIENHILYDGHALSFRLWFPSVVIYQTGLIFSADLFSFVTSHDTFLCEFVVIGKTLKSGSVWSSVVYCVMVSFHLWLLTVKSEKYCSVFQSLLFLITLKHNCIRKKCIWISLEKVKHKLLLLKQPNKAYKSKQLTIFSVIDSNVRSIFLLICLGFVFNISHHTVHYYISNYQ